MRARVPAAVLLAGLLGVGPAAVSVADCCPPREPAAPALAAAGCCGECPSTLTPAREPALLSWKASRPDSGPVLATAAPELAAPELEGAVARAARPRLNFLPRLCPVPLRV